MLKSTRGHSCLKALEDIAVTHLRYDEPPCSVRASAREGQQPTIAVTSLAGPRLPLSEAPEAFLQ